MHTRSRAVTSRLLDIVTEAVMRLPERPVLGVASRLIRRAIDMPDGQDAILGLARQLKAAWPRFSPQVRRRFATNLFGNLMLFSGDKHARVAARLGDWPSIMAISPTMRCTLACDGCYSANYARQDAISTARFDRLLTECEALGIYFVVVTGGEPFLRADLLEMFARHSDIEFLVFTNGTLIAQWDLAPALARLGNVIPCLSVEGYEAETDSRRGRGAYAQVLTAMDALEQEGVPFGFSATPMRHNNEMLVSDEFVDGCIARGAFLGFYFNYMPIGAAPDPSLMPTPDQRLHRLRRVREIRRTKPVFAVDFWCDGELAGGCLSAARVYFHVNAAGGVEPCVFHQFSVDSILDTPLVDALDSPYFRHIRAKLAAFDNPLRPCPIIDRPAVMRDAAVLFRARPSQPGGEALLGGELADGFDRYASELQALIDPEFDRHREHFRWSRIQRAGSASGRQP